MDLMSPALLSYAIHNSSSQEPLLDELMAYTEQHFASGAGMLSGPLEGRLLHFLVALTHAHDILELGTFTGFSALSMASALPAQGKLVTCDQDPRVVDVAKQFAARAPYGHKIEFRLGKALDILATLEKNSFDFIFIDADKMPYPAYFEASLALLRPKGLIVLDNTLWHGEVLASSEKVATMFQALNTQLSQDPRLQVVLLPVRDGITLVRKL